MNKEEYIFYRERNALGDILYEFYKEGHQPEKHPPLMEKTDFFPMFNLWGQGHFFVPSVLSYFDSKFEITVILNKEGQMVKCV